MKSEHLSEGDFWKKLGFQLAGFVVAIIVVIWGASEGYQWWKSRDVEREARVEFAAGNFRAAHGAATRALMEDPSLMDAALIAAQSLDMLNSPEAVGAWARLSQMQKGNADFATRWARSALNWKRDAVALGALNTVPEGARENAAYQGTLGDVLANQNHTAEAERAYAKAVALAPAELDYQIRHAAVVAEHSTDPAKLAVAEQSLRALVASPKHAAAATRSIVVLKVNQKDWPAALLANKPLVDTANSLIADRVQQLTILKHLGGPAFSAALADVQKNAHEAREAAAVLAWMNTSGMTAEALQWAANMEPRMARNPEVARRIAESYLLLKDWRSLRRQCDDLESWGSSEHLRSAYAALALRKTDDLVNANNRWGSAVGTAAPSREDTVELLKLATKWGWRDEVRDILWSSASRLDPSWALASLADIYAEEGSADGLRRVYVRKTEIAPSDDDVRRQMVHFSLLLDRALESSVAQARMLANKHPEAPAFAATLALAELKGGRATDAVAAFSKIPAARLTLPEIALYHGLALIAAGREAEAAAAFALAQKRRLLPEEGALIPPTFRTAAVR